VLAPQAASLDAMVPLRAGAAGRASAERSAIRAGGVVNLATLPLVPITSLQSDAVAVEKRKGAVAIGARRVGLGRVVQLGYEETWRWRMTGGDAAVRDHRTWWTGLVSRAAFARRVPLATPPTASDEAPMTQLVTAIGIGTAAGVVSSVSGKGADGMAWLFVVLALSLIAEVASRRLRGVS
jgi:hypothetical protein